MMQPTWQTKDGSIRLYLGDCLDVLPTLEGVDAVVTDPPYGIGYVQGKKGPGCEGNYHGKKLASERRHYEPITGDDQDFDPSPLLRFSNVLAWGADHFAARLPRGRWLAWDKLDGLKAFDSFSDVEFAWHSKRGAAGIFRYRWKGIASMKIGEANGERFHPTQKPVGLMRWCLDEVGTSRGSIVLDPYMGSGTTGVACIRTGRQFIGVENDAGHFATAVKRIGDELKQHPLLERKPQIQRSLLTPNP